MTINNITKNNTSILDNTNNNIGINSKNVDNIKNVESANKKEGKNNQKIDRTSASLGERLSPKLKEVSKIEIKEANIGKEKAILNEISNEITNISDFTQFKEKIRKYQTQLKEIVEQKEYKLDSQERKFYQLLDNVDNIDNAQSINELKESIVSQIDNIDKQKEQNSNIKKEIINEMRDAIKIEIKQYEEKSKSYPQEAVYKQALNFEADELSNIAGYTVVALSNATPSKSIRLLS